MKAVDKEPRGPRVTADELVAKSRSLLDRARSYLERVVESLRTWFARARRTPHGASRT